MASLEVDLNKIEPGQTITVKWRGKPVFIKRRTEEDIGFARDVDVSTLRDPQTDEERTQNPEVSTDIEGGICESTCAATYMDWIKGGCAVPRCTACKMMSKKCSVLRMFCACSGWCLSASAHILVS